MGNSRFMFRVWNKNTHSFTTGGAIKFGGLCFVDEEDFGIKLAEDQDNYIIEQCTGLKDKNGNLIYEGDVVKDSLLGRKYTVNWDCDCVQFEATANVYDTEFSEIYGLYVNSAKELEVIGNIHEQKDNK